VGFWGGGGVVGMEKALYMERKILG
jgi:hypothetical protein